MSEGKVTGRPRKEVDWDLIDSLCEIHCTKEEICSILGVCEETLTTRTKEAHDMSFSAYYKNKSAGGKMSLRRTQFDTAQKGSVPMLIWLGKQWLNQRDVQELDSNVSLSYSVGVSEPNETPE